MQLVLGVEGVSRMASSGGTFVEMRARSLAVLTFSISLVASFHLTVLVRDSALIDTRKLQVAAV